MARLPRLVVAGLPHLIVHRGINGQPVFLDDDDRTLYLRTLAAAAREFGVAVHGYGLFAGEVRLLATPADAPGLGATMQAVGRRYVRGFNLRHGRSGSPWEGRFRSTVVEAEAHFLPCLRFAEGSDGDGMLLASGTEPQRWSSIAHHLGAAVDPLVTEHPAFWQLGNTPFEREAAYRQVLAQAVPVAEREAIRDAALKGWARGSAGFIARLQAGSDRRPMPLRRGRPAKAFVASAADSVSVPK